MHDKCIENYQKNGRFWYETGIENQTGSGDINRILSHENKMALTEYKPKSKIGTKKLSYSSNRGYPAIYSFEWKKRQKLDLARPESSRDSRTGPSTDQNGPDTK